MEERIKIDENKVIDLYVNQRKSLKKISLEIGVSATKVRSVLLKNKIKLRSRGKTKLFLDEDLIKKVYERGYTRQEIARKLNVSHDTIERRLGIRKD